LSSRTNKTPLRFKASHRASSTPLTSSDHIVRLPASIIDFTFPKNTSRLLRTTGLNSYRIIVYPAHKLSTLRIPDPCIVVFSTDKTISDVTKWIAAHSDTPILHVSTRHHGCDIPLHRLNRATLWRFCKRTIATLVTSGQLSNADAELLLRRSSHYRRRPLAFPQRWHNTTTPNELALFSVGMGFQRVEHLKPSPDDSTCIQAIATSAEKLLSLRPRHVAHPTPQLIITTTDTSPESIKAIKNPPPPLHHQTKTLQKAVNFLRRQKGYFHTATKEELNTLFPTIAPFVALRAREHTTQTDALAARSASEMSPILRLPANTASCRDQVIRLANCFRKEPNYAQTKKLTHVYNELIRTLTHSVPDRFRDVIANTDGGIRIVSDLPFEWLPGARNLPLLYERECSRIPTTPGDLMFTQLLPRDTVLLPRSAISNILVLRSFHRGDKIAPWLKPQSLHIRFRHTFDLSTATPPIAYSRHSPTTKAPS